jgi:hypothetical protein
MTDDAKNDDAADEPKADEPKADEPKVDEPKADEPKADEPKADEPKADEPKAEEPKAEEPKAEEPKAEEPKAEEPKAEEPKAEEPKAEEPKAEEPKAEEPKAEEPKAEEPKDVVAEAKAEVAAAAKADEPKADEPKAEEPAAEEPKAEEPKAEEPKAEEPKAEEPAAEEPAAEEPAAAEAGDAVGASVEDEQPHQGTLVEFETEEALMTACATVRDAGYTRWDAHTPYPVHGLDKAMGIKPTILPWIVFLGGLTGCMAGLVLQFYTNGIELPFSLQGTPLDPFLPSGYKFITSGKPIFSVPANIPVTFELTILLSAFGAFFGMWGLNQMPRFNHPVFSSTRFRRATCDRYFISFEITDPQYDSEKTRVFAETLGGSFVESLSGAEE